MKVVLAKHWIVLVLAVAVGALTAFPQILAEYHMGDAYQGIHPLVIDDQIYYEARAHETADGHPTLGNPYLYEHKDAPGVQFWIPDMLLSYANPVVWDFAFPFLIVVLSYVILCKLTGDKWLSLLTAALLDPGLVYSPFLRTPNPQLFVLLLLALLMLMYSLERPGWKWPVASMLLGGALFYIYPFYWTYWVVMVALACFCALVWRFIGGEKENFKKLSILLGGALVLGVPYFIETYRISKLPFYDESLARFGTLHTHFPSGPALTLLSFAAFAVVTWCWYKKIIPRTPSMILAACAAGAGAVVLNQQVITGLNYFFTVHYATFIVFFSVFALVTCASFALKRYVSARYQAYVLWGFGAAVLLVILMRAGPQAVHMATPQQNDINAQRYSKVLLWLDANTTTDDVVYANPELSMYIPAYTHDNVLFSPTAFLSYISDAEAAERFVANHYFDPEFSRETIIASHTEVFGLYYLSRYQHAAQVNKIRRLIGLAPETVDQYPEEKIDSIAAQATRMRAEPFETAVKNFKVDYVVWDSVKDPDWRVKNANLTQMYEVAGITVYKLGS